ncbi:MAG: GntR family transcriptional regulator [Coriobacteriaceae bacterium]|nr:GntR family transcriptional regulator [Coriobacteriaceae bacterium]
MADEIRAAAERDSSEQNAAAHPAVEFNSTMQDAPMYLRIRQALRDRIAAGYYAPGTMIPSEHELAEEFGTTRLTVRSAVDVLVDAGLVRRVQGKGAFISTAGAAGVPSSTRKSGFRERARLSHAKASVRILARSKRPAGPYYARIFGIEENEPLYSVRRLNSLDDEPVSIEQAFIPLRYFEGIEDVDISVFSLYETYEMYGHRVALAQEKLDIEALSARDAGLLNLEPGDLALVLECISYDQDDVPIEYAISLNRGDRRTYTYRY